MIREVRADKTLLVDGPASVRLLSGEAKVLAAPLGVDETIVIRDGKRTPFYVEKEASFDIALGEGSVVEEVDGDTVPVSWRKMAEEILSLEKPTLVMIMGAVDSGKTSLCTFLANKALRAERTVAIIDSDLGQSDIGPPTTIGIAYVDEPVKDLFNVEADDVCFVGFTSPGGAEERVVSCIIDFKNRVLTEGREFLVINTDGWVDGEEAVRFKVALTETVAADAVVGIEKEESLAPILGKVRSVVLTVEPSIAVRKRDKEKRRVFRELGYKKFLRGSRVEVFPLSWTEIEGVHSSTRLFLTNERLRRIEGALGVRPVLCEESVDRLLIVLRRGESLSPEKLKEAEKVLRKRVRVMRKGDEKGLIVGLHDGEGRFLGLGVVCGIDYRRMVVKVSTPVSQGVATVRMCGVRLNESCREVEAPVTLWS